MSPRVHFPVLCAVLLAGCGEASKPAPGTAGAETRFPLTIGTTAIRARLALTEIELATGLMGTPSLPPGEGMLFAYRDVSGRAFWMKDVPYDIDIGFFDAAGTLAEVDRLRANDLVPVETRSAKIRYAVEAPAGWYAAHGLKPGAALDLNGVARAVRERGFDDAAFVDLK